jgi:hypothetical protein
MRPNRLDKRNVFGILCVTGVLLYSLYQFNVEKTLGLSLSNQFSFYGLTSPMLFDVGNNSIKVANYINHSSFDDYCDSSLGEWAYISNNVYIRKEGVFYFKDAKLLHIRLLKRANIMYDFSLSIVSNDKTISLEDIKYDLRIDAQSSKYNSNIIESQIDLNPFIDSSSSNLKLRVKDLRTNLTISEDLKIKAKNLSTNYEPKKKECLICGKCLYLKGKEDYLALKFWIDAHKRAGYDAIYLCDQDTKYENGSYMELFDTYKGNILVFSENM